MDMTELSIRDVTAGMNFFKSWLRRNVLIECTLSSNIGLKPTKAGGGLLCFDRS